VARSVDPEQQRRARVILIGVIVAVVLFAVVLKSCGGDTPDQIATTSTTQVGATSTTVVSETSSSIVTPASCSDAAIGDQGRERVGSTQASLTAANSSEVVELYGSNNNDDDWQLRVIEANGRVTTQPIPDLIGLGSLKLLGVSRLDAGPTTPIEPLIFLSQGSAPHVDVVSVWRFDSGACAITAVNEQGGSPARFFVGTTQTAFVGLRCTPSVDTSEDLLGDSALTEPRSTDQASSLLLQVSADGAASNGTSFKASDTQRPLVDGELTRGQTKTLDLDVTVFTPLILQYGTALCPGVTSPR